MSKKKSKKELAKESLDLLQSDGFWWVDGEDAIGLFDPVTLPAHYTEGRAIQPIDVIEDWKLDYHLGQVVKYVARAGRKGPIKEDLEKAKWYLERAINKFEDV